jgi:hypothetical protein
LAASDYYILGQPLLPNLFCGIDWALSRFTQKPPFWFMMLAHSLVSVASLATWTISLDFSSLDAGDFEK